MTTTTRQLADNLRDRLTDGSLLLLAATLLVVLSNG